MAKLWKDMTKAERLAVCLAHPREQAAVARLTGTTSSAVGGFMSRNAKALGIERADPERTRVARIGKGHGVNAWDEDQFIERWADRQKARASVGTTYISKTTGRPGNRWTPQMKADFKVLYNKGISLAKIASTLGVGENACKKQRIALALPERRSRRAKNRIQFHIQFDPEEYLLLRDGAERRGSSMVDYVAFLIKRDAGKVL